MVTPPRKVCVDCIRAGLLSGRPRPTPHPGPRCETHWRMERKRRNHARKEAHTVTKYGLTPEEYTRLFDHQGRRCAICRRATGATKRLAVDHDHSCCPGPTSCGGCVRGLVCGPCNGMLAHARDSVELFHRAAQYLREWPARTAGI